MTGDESGNRLRTILIFNIFLFASLTLNTFGQQPTPTSTPAKPAAAQAADGLKMQAVVRRRPPPSDS